mgnify:CR=1 FL=1
MANQYTIYHNPACSKSRKTLALLQEYVDDIEIVDYLNDPPGRRQILVLCQKLGLLPRDIARAKEPIYRDLNLANQPNLSDDAWAVVLSRYPSLIERPIVVCGERAIIGRPPENVLQLING